ncbi:hypothetical protein CPB85DRAFT_162911 [Mucidula mucida]|nr:hypothetical protein CPB85DRAFT_162911 [Mucidula mucida]
MALIQCVLGIPEPITTSLTPSHLQCVLHLVYILIFLPLRRITSRSICDVLGVSIMCSPIRIDPTTTTTPTTTHFSVADYRVQTSQLISTYPDRNRNHSCNIPGVAVSHRFSAICRYLNTNGRSRLLVGRPHEIYNIPMTNGCGSGPIWNTGGEPGYRAEIESKKPS